MRCQPSPSSQQVKVSQDEVVIKQDESGDRFYVVSSGAFDAYLQAPDGTGLLVKEYVAGDLFGELALLYNSPRAATVRCREAGTVYSLERKTFSAVVKEHKSKSKHGLELLLRGVPALSELSPAQITQLASAAELVNYEDREYIIEIGDKADALYIVLSGEVVCHKDNTELMRLGYQQSFGESAVSGSEETAIRQANVVAVGPVQLARLKAADFASTMGSLQGAMQRNFNKKVLDCVELLSPLEDMQKEELLDAFVEVAVDEGERVVTQGDAGTKFYIIKSGVVDIVNNGKKLAELGPEKFFGERSLLTDEPASATVLAQSKVMLLTLEKEHFEALLGPLQVLLEKEMKRREARVHRKSTVDGKLIRWDDLEMLKVLGEGSFGRVYLTNHKPTEKACALKCLRKGQLIRQQQVEHVVSEKRVLDACDHPFILRMNGVFNRGPCIFMLLEFIPGGELFSLLRQEGSFSANQAALYAGMVTLAFGHLHSRKIAHRDLKPENLLFDREGYLKLVDMGFARVIKDRAWTLCGTPEYLSPEIISQKGHDHMVDWWTLGILVYEMLCGDPPFLGASQMDTCSQILAGRFKVPSHVPKSAKEFIVKSLVANPAGRLGSRRGAKEVAATSFLSEVDLARLEARQIQMPYSPQLGGELDSSMFEEYDDNDNSAWDRFQDASYEDIWEQEFSSLDHA